MSSAGKANLMLSALMGTAVAGIAALLGSSVWWLWGGLFGLLESMAIGVCQIAAEEEVRRDRQ